MRRGMGNGVRGTCCTNPLLTFILTSMYVFFLPRTRILKPNLRHTLAQARNWSDALQILAIRITVNLKVGLQHLQLLLGEGGAHAFRLALVITITITALYKGGREKRERESWLVRGEHTGLENVPKPEPGLKAFWQWTKLKMSKVFMVYSRVAFMASTAGGPTTTTTTATGTTTTTSWTRTSSRHAEADHVVWRVAALTLHASVMTRFHQEQLELYLGLPWSFVCLCWRLCGAWRLSKHVKLAKRCVQHVVATCCRCRQFGCCSTYGFFLVTAAWLRLPSLDVVPPSTVSR